MKSLEREEQKTIVGGAAGYWICNKSSSNILHKKVLVAGTNDLYNHYRWFPSHGDPYWVSFK